MRYTIKAHPTDYAGVHFRSRLEAKWAAFFNCMKWKWQYEPVDLQGWTPDFRVTIGKITVYAEVKPYERLDEFRLHPCWDVGLCLGLDLSATGLKWEGKLLTVGDLGYDTERAWIAAGNLTQWKPKPKPKKKKKSWRELLKEGL